MALTLITLIRQRREGREFSKLPPLSKSAHTHTQTHTHTHTHTHAHTHTHTHTFTHLRRHDALATEQHPCALLKRLQRRGRGRQGAKVRNPRKGTLRRGRLQRGRRRSKVRLWIDHARDWRGRRHPCVERAHEKKRERKQENRLQAH